MDKKPIEETADDLAHYAAFRASICGLLKMVPKAWTDRQIVQGLETALSGTGEVVTNLQAALEAVEKRIAELTAALDVAQWEYEAKATPEGHANAIAALESQMAAERQRIAELEQERDLETALIERIQARLDTLKSGASTREEAIFERIAELEQQVARQSNITVIVEPEVVWCSYDCPKATEIDGGVDIPVMALVRRVDDVAGHQRVYRCPKCEREVSVDFPPQSASPPATGWQPSASAPKDGSVILRPHRIWGAMDVRYTVEPPPVTALTSGTKWEWLNGDYTTAWPEEAFLPFWMPSPAPPSADPSPTPSTSPCAHSATEICEQCAPECVAGCCTCGHCACAHTSDPNVLPACCECDCAEFTPDTASISGQEPVP